MKKILITALVATMLTVSLIGCGGNSGSTSSNVSPKEIVKQLEESYIRMPVEIDETTAKEVYHINLDDVEEYAITQTGISPGPGFIMVVKAKEGKVDAVKATVEQVLQDKIAEAFYPDEKELAEKAEVEVDGNIVSLLILNSEVSEEAHQAYKDALK